MRRLPGESKGDRKAIMHDVSWEDNLGYGHHQSFWNNNPNTSLWG